MTKPPALSRGILGFLLGGVALSLLAGCASGTKREWLAFFFDGVPRSSATNGVPAGLTAARSSSGSTNLPAAAGGTVTLLVHVPYNDRQCGECHESKFSQKLKGKMKDLCFACHDNFLEKATVKHAPAESGDCVACHHPHESVEKFLLTKPGSVLCFDCHEPADMEKVKGHAQNGNAACTDCHDPHKAERKFLLRAAAGAPASTQSVETIK